MKIPHLPKNKKPIKIVSSDDPLTIDVINKLYNLAMRNKYCPHINMDKYDEWIKNARENLIWCKEHGKTNDEKYFRELLRYNQKVKKETLNDHNKYCLGNIKICK